MNFLDMIKNSVLERLDGSLSLLHILLALIFSLLAGIFILFIYKKTTQKVAVGRSFMITLLLMCAITATMVLTITSNLALSLGMVGALSIVRFRAAVKDPLDIGFLFWGIAAGITAGAQLYWVAIIGTAVIAVIYIILTIFKKERKSYLLIVRYTADNEINVNGILGQIKYKLKNKTQTGNSVEITVEVKIKNNDTSYISRFNAVEGVESVTLLEYSGEYMN